MARDLSNLIEVIMTIVFTCLFTALTIPMMIMCLLLGIIVGLTCIIEFNCCDCNIFSLTGMCCLGLKSAGMTNRRVALVSFAFAYGFLLSLLYFPFYIILNVLQIPFPYLMLEGLKYHKWFAKKEEPDQTQGSSNA